MDLIEDMCVMDALYWESTTKDENSRYNYKPPIPIKCRWVDVTTKDKGDADNEVVYTSKVFVLIDVKVGDKIMLGTMNDLKAALPPPPKAKEIRIADRVPTIEADEIVRKCLL